MSPDDIKVVLKVTPVFSTMRANLAMADAFVRRSFIENTDREDLGFLWVERGRSQMDAHNSSVATIIVALLYQAVENYYELKRMDSRLEDVSLEDFLSSLDNDGGFVDGMRMMRNSVFHVPKSRHWRKVVKRFSDTCQPNGEVLAIMFEIRNRLYDFTEKVFSGELRIWPDEVYEAWERLERDRPDLMEQSGTSEVDIDEILDAMQP